VPGFLFLTLCTPSSFAVVVVVHSFPLLGPVGKMCGSVAGRVVEGSPVGSLGLALVSSPVVQEVSVEEAFVNGTIVVSFGFVVAASTSEVGLLLEVPARVVGFVLFPFDVAVAAVFAVLFDVVVVAAVVIVLFDVVVAAVVIVLFDVVGAAVVVVWFDVLVAAVVVMLFDVVDPAAVVLLSLLEVLEDELLPLVVPSIVGPLNGNVAGFTTETAVGEVA